MPRAYDDLKTALRTREEDVEENLGVRKTKRAAELKTLYKGFKDVSGKP